MEVINLNLIPNGTNPVVHCSQYDEGREFRFNLFNGTSVLTLDGTETIECDVKKPDGNVVTVAVTNTSSDYIIVATTLQMTACGGNSEGVVNIQKGGVNLYTLNFILYCERNPMENGIQSDSAIHNLNTQISNAVADQYDSNNVIFDNDPTTGHGIGYTVTSEGIKNAIDNAISGLSIPDELNDLSDVNIVNPQANQALIFDLTDPDNPVVTNGTVSTVGNLDDLNDVDTTGKQEGDSLRYIGGEWKAKPTTVKMTQAEYNAIVDFTPYENTHIVITDAPNLNPTASDIEYTSGVSVADKLTSLDNQLAVTSGTFTAQANVSVGSKNAVYRQGHWVFINLVLVCGANISANTNLAQTSIDLGNDIYIPTLLEPEKMIVLKSNGTYISTDFNIANGSILRIGTTIYVP